MIYLSEGQDYLRYYRKAYKTARKLSNKTIDISRLKLIDRQVCIFLSSTGNLKVHDYISEYAVPKSFSNMLSDTY